MRVEKVWNPGSAREMGRGGVRNAWRVDIARTRDCLNSLLTPFSLRKEKKEGRKGGRKKERKGKEKKKRKDEHFFLSVYGLGGLKKFVWLFFFFFSSAWAEEAQPASEFW